MHIAPVREEAPVVRPAPLLRVEPVAPAIPAVRAVQGPVVRGVRPVPDAPPRGSNFPRAKARIDRPLEIDATID